MTIRHDGNCHCLGCMTAFHVWLSTQPAIAIEAGTDTTGTGVACESAGPTAIAMTATPHD